MAGGTTTTHATAVAKWYQAEMQSTLIRESKILQLFPPTRQTGGAGIDWIVKYGGTNSAAEGTEGSAIPSAGNVSTAAAQVTWTKVHTTVEVTNEAIENAAGGYYQPLEVEMAKGREDLINGINTALITDLEAAIDNASTYATLTRSTVSWASLETAISGALTEAAVKTVHETLMGPTYRCDNSQLIALSENNQIQNYCELIKGIQYAENNSDQESPNARGGVIRPNVYWAYDRPWYHLNGMTNTTILFVQRNLVKIVEVRPITVTPKEVLKDSVLYYLSWRGALAYLNPLKAAKLTGVTA